MLDGPATGRWVPEILAENNPDDVKNYRGITLVSCFSKFFTCILNNEIFKWAGQNNVLSDAQFGFRKGCSTTDASYVLNGVIQWTLKRKAI